MSQKEPNADDPLNKEAANEMASKPAEFKANVRRTLAGGFIMCRQVRFLQISNS